MTDEQRTAFLALRALARPSRFRVVADAEGFPIMPGRAGQVEWFDGAALAVCSTRPRVITKLLGLPGLRRHQIGDTEARLLFPPEALGRVAELVRLRRRRAATAVQLQNLARAAMRVASGAQDRVGRVEAGVHRVDGHPRGGGAAFDVLVGRPSGPGGPGRPAGGEGPRP